MKKFLALALLAGGVFGCALDTQVQDILVDELYACPEENYDTGSKTCSSNVVMALSNTKKYYGVANFTQIKGEVKITGRWEDGSGNVVNQETKTVSDESYKMVVELGGGTDYLDGNYKLVFEIEGVSGEIEQEINIYKQ